MRTSPTTEAAGFTLLELLVAITIGSIVMTAVYAVFTTAMQAQRRAQSVIDPMRSAAYAFSTVSDDARNLDPTSKASDIKCSGGSCRFPIIDGKGKREWIEFVHKDDGLRRISRHDDKGEPAKGKPLADMRLCRGLAGVEFDLSAQGRTAAQGAQATGDKSAPGLIGLRLDFGSGAGERAVYRTQVLLEITPQGGQG